MYPHQFRSHGVSGCSFWPLSAGLDEASQACTTARSIRDSSHNLSAIPKAAAHYLLLCQADPISSSAKLSDRLVGNLDAVELDDDGLHARVSFDAHDRGNLARGGEQRKRKTSCVYKHRVDGTVDPRAK